MSLYTGYPAKWRIIYTAIFKTLQSHWNFLLNQWLPHTVIKMIQFFGASQGCSTSRSEVSFVISVNNRAIALRQEWVSPTFTDGPRVPFMLGWTHGERKRIYLFNNSCQRSKGKFCKPRELKDRMKVWKTPLEWEQSYKTKNVNLTVIPKNAWYFGLRKHKTSSSSIKSILKTLQIRQCALELSQVLIVHVQGQWSHTRDLKVKRSSF